jgi:hypothetical protein
MRFPVSARRILVLRARIFLTRRIRSWSAVPTISHFRSSIVLLSATVVGGRIIPLHSAVRVPRPRHTTVFCGPVCRTTILAAPIFSALIFK